MAWSDPFLLGPLGSMRALPSPPHGGSVDVSPVRKGGVREPLMGPPVVDVWGVRREYAFSWPEGQPDVVRRLLRAWNGLDRRPRRLLDPMHGPNLLTLDASTGGAVSRTLAAFDVGSRPLTFAPVLDTPADLDGITGALRWAVPENTADAVRGDLMRPVPVLGRALTVSMFARGAGSVAAQVEPLTLAGTAQSAPIRGPLTALASTAWTRLAVTLPAGSPAVSALPALAAGAGVARTVESTGWQAEHGTAATAWTDGGGCPLVLLADGLEYAYLRLDRRKIDLALREV